MFTGAGVLLLANPALGRRAIRLCLAEPDFFLTQLRAILRASACGPVRLLLPLLSSPDEVRQSMRLIARARDVYARAAGLPGVEVVGIDFQETQPEKAVELVADTGVTYRLLVDRLGDLNGAEPLPNVLVATNISRTKLPSRRNTWMRSLARSQT